MKIIGKTDKGFIIEATQDEVANLLGSKSWWMLTEREGSPLYRKSPNQGDELAVSGIFDWLENMQQYEKRLVDTADTLQKYANGIRPLSLLKRTIDDATLAGPGKEAENGG